jgi:hypothetical protein
MQKRRWCKQRWDISILIIRECSTQAAEEEMHIASAFNAQKGGRVIKSSALPVMRMSLLLRSCEPYCPSLKHSS